MVPLTTIDFTPELIGSVVGAALSLLFGKFPSLRTWYAALKPDIKSAIMLGTLAVASVTIYLLAYFNVIALTSPVTIWRLLSVFFVTASLNQTSYTLTPLSKDVKEIKIVRTINEIQEVKPDAIVVEVTIPELQTVTLETQPKLDLVMGPELKVDDKVLEALKNVPRA
jgi:hypothetical protein